MKDKTGLPDQNYRFDPERRLPTIPARSITAVMLQPGILSNQDGTEVGRYGIHLYGRCMYGAITLKGIYGTDKYDECVYW